VIHLKVLVLNGPNLNRLGKREPDIYGTTTLTELEEQLKELALKNHVELDFAQTNSEGKLIDLIHAAEGSYDYIILNPGAFSHYSIAIRDAICSVQVPVIEVHISNIYAREEFRHKSILAPVTVGQISGFGIYSYTLALLAAIQLNGGGLSNAKY
jgi:3-dehydroquinate dehydratase-2